MTTVIHEIPEVKTIPGLTIRYTIPQDAEWLKQWLMDLSVKDAFPMASDASVHVELLLLEGEFERERFECSLHLLKNCSRNLHPHF